MTDTIPLFSSKRVEIHGSFWRTIVAKWVGSSVLDEGVDGTSLSIW